MVDQKYNTGKDKQSKDEDPWDEVLPPYQYPENTNEQLKRGKDNEKTTTDNRGSRH